MYLMVYCKLFLPTHPFTLITLHLFSKNKRQEKEREEERKVAFEIVTFIQRF